MKSLRINVLAKSFQSISSYLLIGVLFFSSCQELEDQPLAEVEIKEEKFDRFKFLDAVNLATKVYQEEVSNSKKGKNFRSIYEDEQRIDKYIGDIAGALETPTFNYNVIPGDSWDQPITGVNNPKEYEFTQNDLPINLRRHVIAYENKIDNILTRYENNQLSEDQLINEVKIASRAEGNLSEVDPSLTVEERKNLADIFHSSSDLALPIHQLLHLEGGPTNRFFKTRFGKAFGRILLAVVATAIIVAVPVAAVAAGKAWVTGMSLTSVKIGAVQGVGKIVAASLTKGLAVKGTGKISAALLTGLSVGVKSAAEKWDTEWKGWEEETKTLVKIKL
jgi:hypothetical protein